MIYLQPRRYPDIENADVDRSNKDSGPDHDPFRVSSIRHDDPNTIDDDLQKELDLNTPTEDYGV